MIEKNVIKEGFLETFSNLIIVITNKSEVEFL